MSKSKEGFTWTPSTGFSDGLPTVGLVDPPQQFSSRQEDVYDAIVIGAGYAGLVASRDLSTQGKRTLLLEGRDRLGGRTWNTIIDGFNYELGGTWLHWSMPHIYREISLYGLENDWVVTQNPGSALDFFTLSSERGQLQLSHEEEDAMFTRVWSLFCNGDGDYMRQSWKYPFGTEQSSELMAKLDKLSCQDRLEEIRDQLTGKEVAMLVGILQQMGGADLTKMGYLNALHWWILGGHTALGLNQIALHTRLASGNSTLHRRIFDHAVSTGELSYSFSTAVASMKEANGIVTVQSRNGQSWRAKAVICTVPLNVLASIQFEPPLPPAKTEAARAGSVNKCNKIHFEVQGPDYLSWTSLGAPGRGLVSAFGDKLTPAGNTHLVAFGPDPDASNGIRLRDSGTVQKALLHLTPEEKRGQTTIKRIVSHDWNADEFSRGTWCYLPPNFITKYLKDLQAPHGNILFASADWSDGWRGWIDGAVHIGTQAAHQVIKAQEQSKSIVSAPVGTGTPQPRLARSNKL